MSHLFSGIVQLIFNEKLKSVFLLFISLFNENGISNNVCFFQQAKLERKECIFQLASAKFKIPVAILKSFYHVESTQGDDLGKYRVYKRLKDAENITALKTICRKTGRNYRSVTGSFGGAVGETQFMPATWIMYGIDANQDNVKDPWELSDAVYTTANFLAKKGWHKKPLKAIQSYCPKSKAYPKKILKTAEKLFAWNGKF